MLQYITCGESHNKYLAAILEGMPSGLRIDLEGIQSELARRQKGYGRGGRMKLERDEVEVISGVLNGRTTGAPVGFLLANKEVRIHELPELFRPRPGHADLDGSLKYDSGIRAILERASARETSMRVAVGTLTRQFLKEFGIEVASHVVQVGRAVLEDGKTAFAQLKKAAASDMNCVSRDFEAAAVREIEIAKKKGDTLGGVFEVRVQGAPVGLGPHVHHERKLDGRLAQAILSIQAVKGVEFGLGFATAAHYGSEVHDEIFYDAKRGYFRRTNRAGGIEGGMTNGEEIVLRGVMKPISTLIKPLRSVNMKTKKPEKASYERSDISTLPACSVIAEAVTAFEIARAFLEKFGGDSMTEIRRNFEGYRKQIRRS
ncbi:MAG: chorismate synthase [Candidatus Omnitrophica bacterium]|nr:chorismate synthase [Candidatus Omnitrophota bacterium]